MTATLKWFGEQFPPHGALAAEGFGKLLGRPSLDPLTVLVRETAQNSWDARLPRASVRYSIHGFTLDDRQWTSLAYNVYGDGPEEGLPLITEAFEKDSLNVLVISDRHTLGLGGPTRADQPTSGPTDYVDLLMNVGVGTGHEATGGTYGFGKTIAYVVSGARSIVVHSRTANGLPKPETRFIASAISDQFVYHRKRYTGRHWWGREKGGAPEPLTGRAAENLALAVGFPSFADDETGTSIMVIDPNLGDRDPDEAMRFLADAITWNLWPKMVRLNNRLPMRFSVSWNGEPVPIPDPEEFPPLHGFVQALKGVRTHEEPFRRDDGLEVFDIRGQRPNRRLGRLSLYTFVTKPRPLRERGDREDDEETEATSAAPFTGNAHHVALMRTPELVVTYLPGPELPDTTVEWGGVFVCDRDLDSAFAASEPPAHDDWQPSLVVEKSDRRAVNVALREIRETVKSRVALAEGPARPGTASVARIADALAGLVVGIAGTGPGRTPRPGSGSSPRPRRPTVGDPECVPVLVDGERRTRLAFTLTVPSPGPVRIGVRAGVATNDGTGIETEPPVGSAVPTLVRVEGPVVHEVDGQTTEFEADVPASSRWTVLASSPDDVMVAFEVQVEAVDSARTA